MHYQLVSNATDRKLPISDDRAIETLLKVAGYDAAKAMTLKTQLDTETRLDLGYGFSLEVQS